MRGCWVLHTTPKPLLFDSKKLVQDEIHPAINSFPYLTLTENLFGYHAFAEGF
jgi:hypothetical protein